MLSLAVLLGFYSNEEYSIQNQLLSMRRTLNLKATLVMVVLTLPGIKTVHFIYAFGFENVCFPCNSVLLFDSFEFML